MNAPTRYVLGRLREPSTWAGISVIAALFGVPPGTVEAVHQLTAAAIALGAVLLPDRSAGLVAP